MILAETPEIGQGLERFLSCGTRKPERLKRTYQFKCQANIQTLKCYLSAFENTLTQYA